jgi:carboxymethylenebutenolidase
VTSLTEISGFEIAPDYDGFAVLNPDGGTVGLILLAEMFGVTPAMEAAARAFALDGVPTLVPNYFRRSTKAGVFQYEGPDRQQAQERADNLDPRAVREDIGLAIEAFRARVPTLRSIVALGHCIGGGYAVDALSGTSLAAAVSYYGFGIPRLGDALATFAKPAQLHYGLADPLIPEGEVEAVKKFARGNPNIAIFEYEGAGHSFCNPNRPMFDRVQAQTAHARALSLIRARALSLIRGL